MAKAKVLSIGAPGELAVKRALVDALNECIPIIEDQLLIIINSHTIRAKNVMDIGTLDEDAKPEFERLTKALLAARKAIKKAGA